MTLFDSVLDFLGPGAERAREPIFELYLQLSARKAQMTPVAGPGIPKVHTVRAAEAQRGSGVNFCKLQNPSRRVDAPWVVLLEVPRTENG